MLTVWWYLGQVIKKAKHRLASFCDLEVLITPQSCPVGFVQFTVIFGKAQNGSFYAQMRSSVCNMTLSMQKDTVICILLSLSLSRSHIHAHKHAQRKGPVRRAERQEFDLRLTLSGKFPFQRRGFTSFSFKRRPMPYSFAGAQWFIFTQPNRSQSLPVSPCIF